MLRYTFWPRTACMLADQRLMLALLPHLSIVPLAVEVFSRSKGCGSDASTRSMADCGHL